mgnify:CR=1 FL=1
MKAMMQDSKVLVIDNLSIEFGGLKAVSNFSMEMHKKELIGLIGPNGAGKTTIFNLITGLYRPTSGTIQLMGEDITNLVTHKRVQKGIARTFQNIRLFKQLTVLENVGGINYDREKVMNCIASVGLKEVIERLPNSYDTNLLKVIDENGVDLSGGQKQKIAIARALYKEGGIVILDEPTSALDALAEASIYQQFSDLVKDKTSIYISHRLSSTKFCDRILFFNENGLQEEGTHDDLMNNKQGYYEMFMIQGKYYQEGGENND